MNVLLLGSGGRESALAWKLKQSPQLKQLFIAPGNGGTGEWGINVDLDILNFSQIAEFCFSNNIEMLIVGPEAPLVLGIADYLKEDERLTDFYIIGPGQKGSMLEGSKSFAKKFMQKYAIPTASYLEVSSYNMNEGLLYIQNQKGPYVLKADGLAAGKGVLIIESQDEAKIQLKEMLEGKFGKASSVVVLEEFLAGIEFSVFVLTDSRTGRYYMLPEAKDYKRIGENDTGLNTGGMGAISPVHFFNEALKKKVIEKIILPTLEGMRKESMEYIGFIFFGLILVEDEPFVIEYNCRLGDPETEVILPRLKDDLLTLFQSLKWPSSNITPEIIDKTAAAMMLVSAGYPEAYKKGIEISGFEKITDSLVFHAGTRLDKDGRIFTNGGRVLAITSISNSVQDAVDLSLKSAEKISFEGKYYRRDIGFDLK